jgi:hypothetical protein
LALHVQSYWSMFKSILSFFGRREARKRGIPLAPFGGLAPMVAWLAWTNRDKIISAYHSYVEPRLHRGGAQTA